MVLELHVWGPALGLPSIDPECLGIITYFTYAVPKTEWSLLVSSPSTTPTYALPSLHDPTTGAWVSGFRPIVAHLQSLLPSSPLVDIKDLDASLPEHTRADSTAYAAFLSAHAAPLLALSLYVSSENWVSVVRPAYSTILPFPLTWTEVPAMRAAATRRAAHLGFSGLDTDAKPEQDGPGGVDGGTAAAQETPSRILSQIPKSLRPRKPKAASEKAAQKRLKTAAVECLAVLADLKGKDEDKKHLLGDGSGRPAALDCLAFGYLALMLVPELPRPFLRDILQKRFGGLCSFVEDMRRECYGASSANPAEDDGLPWAPRAQTSLPSLASRFTQGALGSIPGLGEEWRHWALQQRLGRAAVIEDNNRAEESKSSELAAAGDMVLAVATTAVSGIAIIGGLALYRNLMPFGSPVIRYEREKRGLGATGAFFALPGMMAFEGHDFSLGAEEPMARGPADVSADNGGSPPVVEVDVEVGTTKQ